MRQGEQKLWQAGMRVLGPLVPQWQHLETARLDDCLVFLGVDRADRVDDRPTRTHPLGGRAQERQLEFGERGRAPAQIGSLSEDPETGAGRIDESTIEALEIERELRSVGFDHGYVRRT